MPGEMERSNTRTIYCGRPSSLALTVKGPNHGRTGAQIGCITACSEPLLNSLAR